ncbi:MAG: L,D-transpeptidase family protein [Actinomycetota bacterium]
MARGKHSRGSVGKGTAVALLVVVAVVALGGGAAFAASRFDSAAAVRILPGVRIAGVDVGGMTHDEAVRAVDRRADLTLERDLTVRTAGYSWHVTPAALGTRADVEGAVDRAFALADQMSLLSRVYHRVADKPVTMSVDLAYRYDRAKVSAFVYQAYDEVTTPAVNAGIKLVDDELVMRHAHEGQELLVQAAVGRVRRALARDEAAVRVPVRPVAPKVTDDALGKTIVVDISENRLYLYSGFHIEKQYAVATAAQGFVTPVGSWSIVNKVENPSWTNPDPTGWGAGMPAYIPPGPGNPLGTRALYLNAPGIRIHGTEDVSSIGTYASHGCIRMLMSDVEELYPLVPVGTPVLVKP